MMGEIISFPIQTKTIDDLEVLSAANSELTDPLLIYDESVGVWKVINLGDIVAGSVTILDSVTELSQIDGSLLTNHQPFQLKSFSPTGYQGGGLLLWDSTIPKLDHDGERYFSPSVPAPTDFNDSAQVSNYKAGVGEMYPTEDGVFVLTLSANESVNIDNVAKLSSVSPIPGLTYNLKEYSSGTGKGGGDLLAKSGVITANNVTTFASATSGVYFERINIDILTLAHAGALGTGADDTAAINRALALQLPIDGQHLTYGVTGDLDNQERIWFVNAELTQLDANDPNRRTINLVGGTNIYLKNIKVNRNGNGLGGGLATAAGIWLSGCDNVTLDNVEVYGNDYGNGIALLDCTDVRLYNPVVRDIRAGDASAAVITDDKVQGIWIQRGSNIKAFNPSVKRLRCQWSGQASTPRFTRGITIGGASGVELYAVYVYSVDQCIDISGDEDPTRIKIFGGHLLEGATFGLKCANSPTFVEAHGMTFEKCGNSGFIASAPGSALSTMTSKIELHGCKALGTGFDTGGAGGSNVGFRITNSAGALNYPHSVRFINCIADDDSLGLMEIGFANDAEIFNGNSYNEALGCKSIGHTTAGLSGFTAGKLAYVAGRYYGGGFINPSNAAPLALAANTLYVVPFEVTSDWKFSDLSFVVSAGSAGNARVGVYAWADGKPTKLLYDIGTADVTAGGTKSVAFNQTLQSGIYGLAIVCSSTPSVYCSTPSIQMMSAVGLTVIGTSDAQISRAFAYGALPADFGAVTYTNANIPNLILRA